MKKKKHNKHKDGKNCTPLGKPETYQLRFLSEHRMAKRGEKSIYIRPEYHEKLYRVVKVIGVNQITLSAYLDNIIGHHFELFDEAITKGFDEHYNPIF